MPERRKRKPSSLPYLLLNIIISAVTTLTVILIWNKVQESRQPADEVLDFQEKLAQSTLINSEVIETDAPVPLPALDQTVIEIENVFGKGDLENEVIVLNRVGEDELWMTGWTLTDGSEHIYTFNELVINKDASIQLYTSAGHDGVNALYWGLSASIWESGKTVSLYDYKGNLRAKYKIP